MESEVDVEVEDVDVAADGVPEPDDPLEELSPLVDPPEVSAMPSVREPAEPPDPAPPVLDDSEPWRPTDGTWRGWAPVTVGGEPGPDCPCRMCTETEVSRNRTISVASPNMGTMLPAG